MKVLVVDDDAAVRDSLARTLKFEGHEVATAADGQEALDAVHDDVPDAMILMSACLGWMDWRRAGS